MIQIKNVKKTYWELRSRQIQKWRYLRFRALHRGHDRLCNICGWQGSEFYPLALERTPDVVCPVCQSKPRQRLLKHVLINCGLPKPGARILHISPKGEYGLSKWFRSIAGSYVSIDKGGIWNTVEQGTVEMDLTELKFQDNSFDFVNCSHVLEHIENDLKAMSEIYRVLAPGGVLACQIQIYGETTVRVEKPTREDYFHAWHPGLDYFSKFESIGFKVNIYRKGEANASLLGLISDGIVPLCIKQ